MLCINKLSDIHCRNGPDRMLLPLSLQTSNQARADIHNTWSSSDAEADIKALSFSSAEEALNSCRQISNK